MGSWVMWSGPNVEVADAISSGSEGGRCESSVGVGACMVLTLGLGAPCDEDSDGCAW